MKSGHGSFSWNRTRPGSARPAGADMTPTPAASATRPVTTRDTNLMLFPRDEGSHTGGAGAMAPIRVHSRSGGEPNVGERANDCTVTVIGAGLGGVGLVANLGLAGYRMRLHDRDASRLVAMQKRGGIDVEGLVQGFAPAEIVTSELAPAVDGADVIIVGTGSHFHAAR